MINLTDCQKEAIKNLYNIIEYSKNYLSKDLQIVKKKLLKKLLLGILTRIKKLILSLQDWQEQVNLP